MEMLAVPVVLLAYGAAVVLEEVFFPRKHLLDRIEEANSVCKE